VRQHIRRAQRHDAHGWRIVAAAGKSVDDLVDRTIAARHRDHAVTACVAGFSQPPRIARRGGFDDVDAPSLLAHAGRDGVDQPAPAASGRRIDDQQQGFGGNDVH
jgi:hypothetical protein